MRFGVGVIFSIILHLGVVAFAFISLPSDWLPDVASEPAIPIELIALAEDAMKTSVPAARPEPAEIEEPEPDLPEPEPEIEPEPETEPEPVAPAPEPEPEPEPVKPEPNPDPVVTEPEPEPEKEDDLDLDALSALVDISREHEAPEATTPTPSETMMEAQTAREAIGAGDRLAASDRAKFVAAMRRCWNPPIGAPDPEKLNVEVGFTLNPDGSLNGQPRVLNATQIALSGNRFWKVAEQNALRAVVSCQPYDFLSPDRYEVWKEVELNFDMREMAGM